jgi:hypothetical protein
MKHRACHKVTTDCRQLRIARSRHRSPIAAFWYVLEPLVKRVIRVIGLKKASNATSDVWLQEKLAHAWKAQYSVRIYEKNQLI